MDNYKNIKQYRHKGHDYSKNGFYFVTICVKNRQMLFGEIRDNRFVTNKIGEIVEMQWKEVIKNYPFVNLDEYIVMPNHFHGILEIDMSVQEKNAPRRVPTEEFQSPKGIIPLVANSLPSILNHFKGGVKKFCNQNGMEYFSWQPRYYDRVIRNEVELSNIREYIKNNPLKWEIDRNNIEDLYM